MGTHIDIKGSITGATSSYVCSLLSGMQGGEVTLVINSIGGSVVETFSIVSSIMQAQERGVIVKTLCTGVADSCASWVLAMGNKGERVVMPMASALVHPVQVPTGKKDDDGNDIRESIYEVERNNENSQIFIISEQMENLVSKQTGMSISEIQKLFKANGGFGTALTAEELVKYGYADRIFQSSQLTNENIFLQSLFKSKNENRMEVYNVMLAVNSSDFVNNKLENFKKSKSMDLQNVSKSLGIDSQSTEQEVLARVSNIKSENADLKQQLKLQSEQIEKYNKERVMLIVNSAVSNFKIKESDKEKLALKAENYKSVDVFAKEVEEMPVLETLRNESLSKLGNSKYANGLKNTDQGKKNKAELLTANEIDWKEKESENMKNDDDPAHKDDQKNKFTEEEAVNMFDEMSDEEKKELKEKNEEVYNRLQACSQKNKSKNETETAKKIENIAKILKF